MCASSSANSADGGVSEFLFYCSLRLVNFSFTLPCLHTFGGYQLLYFFSALHLPFQFYYCVSLLFHAYLLNTLPSSILISWLSTVFCMKWIRSIWKKSVQIQFLYISESSKYWNIRFASDRKQSFFLSFSEEKIIIVSNLLQATKTPWQIRVCDTNQ